MCLRRERQDERLREDDAERDECAGDDDERVDDVIAEPPRRLFARRREVLVNVGTNAALIAPSANRSRSRLGMRNATLYASMAAPAPKNEATTCSRTTPRMRLVIVAMPAEAADRASVDEDVGSDAKRAADGFVDGLPVGILAGELRHDGLHHLAESFADVAPVSAIASATAASISSGVADGGR